ncbi:MAG: hypothetical protein IT366_24570 [Candidatus Hydrogenedentes bacterium]|nr:hypothetical protein [Candidatus Hydrogenedentota bacterium]
MTFLEIYTEGFDRMGVGVSEADAEDLAMMKRFANEAAQYVAVALRLPELEKSAGITFQTSGLTALPSWVAAVTYVLNASGVPLDMKTRTNFNDLYRGDTTAATDPSACCVEGMDASGNLQVRTWPVINSTRAGTVEGMRRIAVMVADGDVPEIPSEKHFLIVDRMVALFREWEESEAVGVAQSRSESGIQRVS